MFDDKNNIESDLLMRSILSQAEEEVPSHVWDGISSELDRIAAQKTVKPVVVWFKRSAVAVAAAAAIAVGVVMNWDKNSETNLVPEAAGTDLIAVAEPVAPIQEEQVAPAQPKPVLANIQKPAAKPTATMSQRTEVADIEEAEKATKTESKVETIQEQIEKKAPKTYVAEAVNIIDDWADEDDEEKIRSNKVRTSIVLSGLAGTNGSKNNIGNGTLMRPSSSTTRPQTGVRQTGTESTYGLPLSFGIGAKIGLSPRWSLGVGVNYTLLSRQFEGTYTNADNPDNILIIPTNDIRNTQHFIGIPINAYYNIISRDHLNFYAYAGAAVEKCVSNKYDVLGKNVVHSERVKGLQYSANIGLGLEFLLGEHLGLYFDPSLRYYFKNHQPKSIRTEQPLMMGFELGFRINL